YAGFNEPGRLTPSGPALPVREDAPLVTTLDVGESVPIKFAQNMVRTEEAVFAAHPGATYFIYPVVDGPRRLAPRAWSGLPPRRALAPLQGRLRPAGRQPLRPHPARHGQGPGRARVPRRGDAPGGTPGVGRLVPPVSGGSRPDHRRLRRPVRLRTRGHDHRR